MDSKGKSQRKVLAAKAESVPRGKTEKKAASKKDGKATEKDCMPDLIAGALCVKPLPELSLESLVLAWLLL